MSLKRQRVEVELAPTGQAALPSVCYLPSLPEGTGHEKANSQHSPAKRLKFCVHSKPRLGSTVQLVQASVGDIHYVGRSDGDENKGVQPCCFALGVYRPGEGKLQLVNVAGDRLFRLDPRLPGLVYTATGAGAPTDADEREMRKAAARRLVDEFGSTRRRRQMTAREAGMVTADRINSGEEVQQLLDDIAAKGQKQGMTREEVTRRAFAQRTIPPHNPAATSPADAYPLELLLGRPLAAEGEGTGAGGGEAGGLQADDGTLVGELNVAQIHKLTEDDEELAKAREKKLIPAYVISRLGPLRNLKTNAADDPAARTRTRARARYLALLAVLLRIHDRSHLKPKSEGLSGVARELRVREGLAEFILDRFYVKSEHPLHGMRYERPTAQSQLLLSYILAVAMVVEEGFMDKEQFEELRAALKMDSAKVVAALQQLGCTTKSAKLRVEEGDQVMDVPSYSASLLKQSGSGPGLKTLEQCFPALKLPKAKNKGR